MKIRPGSPVLPVIAGAVCVVFAAWIAYGQLGPVPALLDGEPGPVLLDVRRAPCPPKRYQEECARWVAAGWPACDVGASGGVVVVELLGGELDPEHKAAVGPVRGDPSQWYFGHPVDACRAEDLTIGHEIGHLYKLRDGGPAGSIMALPFPLADLPRAGDAGDVPATSRVGRRYPRVP